jgi:endonuclease G
VLSYQVNASEQSRKLDIILDDGLHWVSCSVEQMGSGKQPEPEPDPAPDTELPKTGWLELPAMDDPGLGYYSHSFKMNGKTYRNYSFGWSQEDRVALWVAYPLCKLYTNGSAGRTNEWALDPLLGEDSAAPFGGYAGSYARGHQLPSADRQCCYEANAQTFYGTNMTPQLNAHNEGIWADLEGRVRGWANTSDTTYVVTGVVVSPSSKKEKDSYGKSVTVPDAYFKAVLKYSKSSTLGMWNAAAFYLEHKAYSGNVGKEHSMSVDRLEEITGIDFFVNLPAKLGDDQAAAIEAADPSKSSVWW